MTDLAEAARVELLCRAPLFQHLSPDDLETVARLFEERTWRKGEVVCEEGDPGHTFYVVVTGELEVWSSGDSPRLLNRLGPGDVLGEMSLLFEGRRTATVRVSRSARLLSLDRPAFNRFFAQNPRVLHYFSALLSHRLAANARDDTVGDRTRVVGVVGAPDLPGKSLVAQVLASLLRETSRGEVLLVRGCRPAKAKRARPQALRLTDLHAAPADRLKSHLEIRSGEPTRLALAVSPRDEEGALVQGLNALISRLGESFCCIVLDLGKGVRASTPAVAEVSDILVELVADAEPGITEEPDAPTRILRVVNRLGSMSLPIPINPCEPFVLPETPEIRNRPAAAAAEYLLSHSELPILAPLRRLARKILGMSVGIALGGGAAFGIVHVGVIKAFEESGLPLDLVAGTSMGSIVAIGWAAGLSGSEMHEIALEIGTVPKTLSALDFTLTRPGLFAGDRLIQIFAPLLGPVRRFEHLRHPCRTVATDIQSGERVWIGEGLLEQAFRASASVPMLWSPVQRDDRILVDGAIVDPLPADVVHEMGADLCIAVNAVPPLRKGVDNVLTRAWRHLNRLNPLAYLGGSCDMPNTFDITMSSIQILQHELGNFKAISADLRITPDLSDFTWIEFHRPQEIIDRGVAAAERAIPDIRRLLDERRLGGRAR
jgi:NTE family protein